MARSKLPQGALHDVFYAGNGTLSQVLDETIVVRALRQEVSESRADGHRNSISGFRTALLLSVGFWVVLAAVISAVV